MTEALAFLGAIALLELVLIQGWIIYHMVLLDQIAKSVLGIR